MGTTGTREYHPTQYNQTGTAVEFPATWTTDYDCMLIGSHGSEYLKDKAVPKKSSKPGGKFLVGVSDDLEIIQDMIGKDPRKNLAHVCSDFPGVQRSRSYYLNRIKTLLKSSQKNGGRHVISLVYMCNVGHYSGA